MDRAATTEPWWVATDVANLRQQLDLTARPQRAASGRALKEQQERWMMTRWLVAWTTQLAYPIRVYKGESPDFRLDTAVGQVGVECMEVVPEAYKQLLAKLNSTNSAWARPVARYEPNGRRPKADTPMLRQLFADTYEGSEWQDDEPERLWVDVMRAAVKKREVFRKPAFASLSRNALLLYDNWPLPPVAFAEDAAEESLRDWALAALDVLSAELTQSGAFADFQQIDILHQGWLLSFTSDGVRRMPCLSPEAE